MVERKKLKITTVFPMTVTTMAIMISITSWVMPPLINSWIAFIIYLYRTHNMAPIIDC